MQVEETWQETAPLETQLAKLSSRGQVYDQQRLQIWRPSHQVKAVGECLFPPMLTSRLPVVPAAL